MVRHDPNAPDSVSEKLSDLALFSLRKVRSPASGRTSSTSRANGDQTPPAGRITETIGTPRRRLLRLEVAFTLTEASNGPSGRLAARASDRFRREGRSVSNRSGEAWWVL